MSKSLGNGINPLDIIESSGADALRFSLIYGITRGNDIKYSDDKLKRATNFNNKIWNAARYIVFNPCFDLVDNTLQLEDILNKKEELKVEDKWIIHEYMNILKQVENDLGTYDFRSCIR